MEQVTVWRCSDGATFESQEEAEAHQDALKDAEQVERFIASREWTRGQATRARNILTEFLAWRDA